MIQEITSRQNARVKYANSLHQQAFREENQQFIIEGDHLLEIALQVKLVREVFTLKKLSLPDEIKQYLVTEDILQKISSSQHPQGCVAICDYPKNAGHFGDKVLYLDGISDPGNLGTLLRTAVAFGYQDVILSKECCSVFNDKAIQASQGAIFLLNLHYESKTLTNLKKSGYQVIATELKSSVLMEKFKPTNKHVLILGNEAHGVSNECKKIADARIRIDMDGIESLNVGVAGGILMHYLTHF